MNRSLALWLLALTTACRATPVLNDTVEEPDAPPAAPVTSNAAPVASSAPLIYSNVLSLSGFPSCPAEPSPEPIEPLVWVGPGDRFKPPKHRPRSFDSYDVREFGFRLETCLERTLHEKTRSAVTIGVLPSGVVCEPKLVSTVPLPAECVACLAKRLHAYRFATSTGSPPLIINLPPFTPATR